MSAEYKWSCFIAKKVSSNSSGVTGKKSRFFPVKINSVSVSQADNTGPRVVLNHIAEHSR